MYYFLFTLNALLMLVPAVLLGRVIARKRKIGWSVFLAGALTFILSQVGHLPFNGLILPLINDRIEQWPETAGLVALSVFLGLSAGVFEEGARFLTYTYWRKDVRSWGGGLMLGAGHGGIEAIILGLIFAVNFFILAAYDGGLLPNLLANVPLEQLPEAQETLRFQIDTFFSLPWYATILGGLERVFAVILHLSLSLLVMQAVVRGQRRWLLFSIGWHALVNAGAVIIIGLFNEYLAELYIALCALVSLFIIHHFKEPEQVEPEPDPLPPLKVMELSEAEASPSALEKSRFF